MNQVLSQSEVDALLNAVSDGSINVNAPGGAGGAAGGAGGAAEENPDIQPYDLTNQDRVIRGRMPTLDIIYERFIRLFRMSLSNSLRKIASISIISTDLLKFGEFVNTLPIPSCMAILRFEALRGPALLVFESKLSYALVDSYFGGTDRPYAKMDGKEFTRIELSIMNKVMELAVHDLDQAWQPVHQVKVEMVRLEVNPQFVGVVPPSDVIVSTTFEVELENASGTVALVVPYSTLEPIKHKLNQSFQSESERGDQQWSGILEQHLLQTHADVVVNLGGTNITVGDLINLNVGDIIPLWQDCDAELQFVVEGVPKFKCFFGVSRGNRAIQVTRAITD